MFLKLKFYLLLINIVISVALNENSSENLDTQLNWECLNNSTCVKQISYNIINKLKHKLPINIGQISVEPISQQNDKVTSTGRSTMSSLMQLVNGNRVKIPLGPILLSVQKSSDDENYLEVSLLKKIGNEEGSKRSTDKSAKDRNEDDVGENRQRIRHHEKKLFQIFIPLFLAFNAFGWTMLAVKAVSVLTFKAFFISKIAFLAGLVIIVKKIMEAATLRMMASQQHFEHPETFGMPYNMEYAYPSFHTNDFANNELYALQMSNLHDVGLHNAGGLLTAAQFDAIGTDVGGGGGHEVGTAESTINNVISVHNITQGQQIPIMHTPFFPKVKRQDRNDMWTGIRNTKPVLYVPPEKRPVYMYRGVQH